MASNAPDKVDSGSRPTPPTAPTPKPAPAPAASAPDSTSDPKAKPKDLASEVETGGLSSFRQHDHVIAGAVQKVEDPIKAGINKLKKDGPQLGKGDKLEVVGYRMNIVNGYLYFAKIKIHGDSFVQARILQTPKGEVSLQSVTETKTDADEREYFKLPSSK